MYALNHAAWIYLLRGNYTEVRSLAESIISLAEEKHAMLWKAGGMLSKGCVFALTGDSGAIQEAIETFTAGIAGWSSTGATTWLAWYQVYLAKARAELGQFDEAWRNVQEAITAIENSKETWWEADVNRVAGEIARKSEADGLKAEQYFDHALVVARQQRAKSWELRAAMSMARLWRDQGKPQQARELLAPVYGWFTEGFDTLDLKEAKALLMELAA